MKKHIIQISFALFVMGVMSGCHDHDDFPGPQNNTNVEFDSLQVMVPENKEQHIVQITFDKAAVQNGSLSLSVNNAQQSRFVIEPESSNDQITLDILKGQTSTSFRIKPVNNFLTDGDWDFEITIVSASPPFTVGEKKSISVKLKDDDLPIPTQLVANFNNTDKNVKENDIEGKTFSVQLSEALTAPGSIELSIESDQAVYGTHFITEPGAIAGKIILNPSIGQATADIAILPINNSIITGEFEITLTIVNTTGSIIKGTTLTQDVIITDDELSNKPKGYEIGGGGWSLKKIYEYDELGRVKYVRSEKSTPANSSHTETYFYDATGKIQKINTYPEIDVTFTWLNDRIIKSESFDHGLIKQYNQYDYDDHGNLSGAASYFRQSNGQFKLGFLNIYLYFPDGNLFKSQTYIPGDEPNEYTLISTRTYDDYLPKENPFPMVEILPTVRTQTKLPSRYTIEENGVTLSYSFTYEYNAAGLVTKRLARSGSLTETALYQYY